MEANRAKSSDSPEIMELLGESERFAPCQRSNVVYPNTTEQLAGRCLVDFLSYVPEGHGGGLAFSFTTMRLFAVAEILLQNVTISGNEALVGGEPV